MTEAGGSTAALPTLAAVPQARVVTPYYGPSIDEISSTETTVFRCN